MLVCGGMFHRSVDDARPALFRSAKYLAYLCVPTLCGGVDEPTQYLVLSGSEFFIVCHLSLPIGVVTASTAK